MRRLPKRNSEARWVTVTFIVTHGSVPISGRLILGRSPAGRGLVKKQADQVFWEFPTDYPQQLEQRIGTAPIGTAPIPAAQNVSPEIYTQYPAGHQYQTQQPTVPSQGVKFGETWEVQTEKAEIIQGLAPPSDLIISQPWRAN